MKLVTRKLLKIVISIIYIAWGILSPITLLDAIISLDMSAIMSAVIGVLTLFAGIFGLIGIKKLKCRIFGFVIFAVSLAAVVTALPAISIHSIVTAVLTLLFIVCI